MASILSYRLIRQDELTLTYEVRTDPELGPERLLIHRRDPLAAPAESAPCRRARRLILLERERSGEWPATGRRMS